MYLCECFLSITISHFLQNIFKVGNLRDVEAEGNIEKK